MNLEVKLTYRLAQTPLYANFINIHILHSPAGILGNKNIMPLNCLCASINLKVYQEPLSYLLFKTQEGLLRARNPSQHEYEEDASLFRVCVAFRGCDQHRSVRRRVGGVVTHRMERTPAVLSLLLSTGGISFIMLPMSISQCNRF